MNNQQKCDQPMYYENKYEGEWKYQKKERYVRYYERYQLITFISVVVVIFILLSIGLYIKHNAGLSTESENVAASLLVIALLLDFIFLNLTFDIQELGEVK